MIYRITPADAALVLTRADLPLTKERELIATLWKNHRHVERRYQDDESLFARAIRREMLKQERTRDAEDQALLAGEGDALEVAVRQGGGDPVLRYFQLIRLEATPRARTSATRHETTYTTARPRLQETLPTTSQTNQPSPASNTTTDPHARPNPHPHRGRRPRHNDHLPTPPPPLALHTAVAVKSPQGQ